jgi:putative membrane protein
MVLPLFLVGLWSTFITCISKFVHERKPLGLLDALTPCTNRISVAVSTLLLTVLGFVISLALSFRSTTAYERYSDGRKSWATLSVQSRNLARYIWVHIDERPGEFAKQDLIAKITGMNLVLAFAVALKHKLRFEPYGHYEDIVSLISHLDTYATRAYTPELQISRKKLFWKELGMKLGVSFAESNPRKALKRATKPVGNLPMEILTYLSCYVEEASTNGTLKSAVVYGQIRKLLAPPQYSSIKFCYHQLLAKK